MVEDIEDRKDKEEKEEIEGQRILCHLMHLTVFLVFQEKMVHVVLQVILEIIPNNMFLGRIHSDIKVFLELSRVRFKKLIEKVGSSSIKCFF